ncbi:Hpt domain-containing protein [Bathymodiolus japonicus methanotrophic gill symbiont]|uniref:Hpt domain-containing protein n=1 Tax=Bathymodiolus japonicus methanotrophic gill symbiont TaxID=113269 RepID=UPI001C8EC509|nr:Hpt domain-containing protein [Bathymodiolus japonicus methanotrophic gill symbiont]
MIKIKKMEIFEWCYLQVGYRLLCLGTSSFNGNTDEGNRKLYRRLLLKFMHSEQDFTEKFQQAQLSDDADAATRVAHTLKGVAGNIAAHEIQKAAQALELACKEKLDNKQIEDLLTTVAATLTPVLESLEQLQSEPEIATASIKKVNTGKLISLYKNCSLCLWMMMLMPLMCWRKLLIY